MVSIESVKKGTCDFFDRNILSGYNGEGWKKVVVPAVAGIAINSYIDKLAKSEFVLGTGLVENGMVDVDLLATEIKKRITDAGMKIDISMIGSATFYKADVDELVRMIKEGY